jgi:hypothetical protein
MSFFEDWCEDLNILKAYEKVRNVLEGSLVESEAFEWEWNLDEKINDVKKMIKEIYDGDDFCVPLFYYKVPKNSGKERDYYYVPFDYQVLWISFLNVFGPHIDKIMPRYSFGYRLWRPFGKNLATGKWEYGRYKAPGKEIYRSFNMSYKPFRRYQKIFLSNILGIEMDEIEEEMFKMEHDKKSVIWVSEWVENGGNDSIDVWKSRFPLFCFGNSNGCDNEKKNLYYMKIDIKKFFPSIDIDKLENKIEKILDLINNNDDRENIIKYLKKLLNFEICGVFGDYEKPENIGLPIGLLSSGFLANIYLFDLDVKMDKLIKKSFNERKILGYFRYVDDIVVISDDIKKIREVFDEIDSELKELNLSVNLEKLKPKISSDYCRLTQFVPKNEEKEKDISDELIKKILFLVDLEDDEEIENLEEEKRNLKFILNIEDDMSIEELRNLFLKEFELTKENYHGFQTTVFNEMSVLSEKIFGLSTMENLQENFNRVRNLIRAHLDEDKIAPQTRQSFSAHFITKIVENVLKHPASYKGEQWVSLENELELENLSVVVKEKEEKENDRNIKNIIKNALADVEYAIVNTPSKTKLYKRYIELIYLIYENDYKTRVNDYLKYLLNIINTKINVKESVIPYLYYEFFKNINKVLNEKSNKKNSIPENFLKEIKFAVEYIIDIMITEKNKFRENLMLFAELLDTLTILKIFEYNIDKKIEEFFKIIEDKTSSFNKDVFRELIMTKLRVYKWLKKESLDENDSLCYILLLKLFKFDGFITTENIRNFLDVLNRVGSKQLKLYGYLILRIYFLINDRKTREFVIKQSLDFIKKLNFNEQSYKNYNRLLQVLLHGIYEGAITFDKELRDYIFKHSIDNSIDNDNKIGLVFNNIKEFLEIRCLEDKSNMGVISIANFLSMVDLTYFQKILLAFLVVNAVEIEKGNSEKTMFDEILKIKIDTKKFHKIFKKLQTGKMGVEEFEKELKKNKIENPVKIEEKILEEELYWLVFQILKGEFLLESLSLPSDYEIKYLLKNIWKKLIEGLFASSDIANKIADKIGLYKHIELKPYNSSKKDLKEILLEELNRQLFKKRPLIKMELPLQIYGNKELKPFIRVGIFQPTVNYFKEDYKYLNEDLRYQKYIVNSLRKELTIALGVFQDQNIDLFIAPELSIPKDVENDLIEWSKKTGIVAIYGTEYILNEIHREVRNRYVLLWPYNDINILKINGFKKFFNYVEKSEFEKRNIKIKESDKIILFTSKNIGVFSVLICYDALSIEDLATLKGYVDTIFVPAYNKDVNTYKGLADAMSKLVFCNFVIANTGVYGGSVVRIPYYKIHKREALTLEGNGIFGAQVVDIPIKHLQDYRRTIPKLDKDFKNRKFKSFPPGYEYKEM